MQSWQLFDWSQNMGLESESYNHTMATYLLQKVDDSKCDIIGINNAFKIKQHQILNFLTNLDVLGIRNI